MESHLLKTSGINIHYYTWDKIDPNKDTLIFLHGFTGDTSDWFFLAENFNPGYNLIFIDLPGHGQSVEFADKSSFTTEAMCRQILEILKSESIDDSVFVGYSMGGRLAMSFAINYPHKVKGLFLESSTAGIESVDLRNERYLNDLKLAEKIETEGIDNFIDYWFGIPLFESLKNLPDEKLKSEILKRKQNSAEGLINSLTEFSQGKMPSVWSRLKEFNFPVHLVTGSLDTKFCDLNFKMNSILPNSELSIIEGAGHNTHLEKPEEFIILLTSFLRTLKA